MIHVALHHQHATLELPDSAASHRHFMLIFDGTNMGAEAAPLVPYGVMSSIHLHSVLSRTTITCMELASSA